MQNHRSLELQQLKTKKWALTGKWSSSLYDRYLSAIAGSVVVRSRRVLPKSQNSEFFKTIGAAGGCKNKGRIPWNKGLKYHLKDKFELSPE